MNVKTTLDEMCEVTQYLSESDRPTLEHMMAGLPEILEGSEMDSPANREALQRIIKLYER